MVQTLTNCHFEFHNFRIDHLNCIFYSFRDTITFFIVCTKFSNCREKGLFYLFALQNIIFWRAMIRRKLICKQFNIETSIVSTSHSLHHRCIRLFHKGALLPTSVLGVWKNHRGHLINTRLSQCT